MIIICYVCADLGHFFCLVHGLGGIHLGGGQPLRHLSLEISLTSVKCGYSGRLLNRLVNE